MSRRRGLVGILLALGAVAGCAADPATVPCGTEDVPGELRITKHAPALGASVKNLAIEESFTVGDSPIDFDVQGILVEAAAHKAGYDVSEFDSWGYSVSGRDVTFQRVVDSWSEAPAHVELEAIAGWKTEEGCHYKLPKPALSYEVVP